MSEISDKWRDAADQGDPEAQTRLGVLYSEGQGVERNYETAAGWFLKAAEQGDIYAQNNLGDMYDSGQGVDQDFGEAAKWYRKAAEADDSYAQHRLGELHGEGLGVEMNACQAFAWFNLAAAGGFPSSAECREDVVAKLTETELKDAQRLALELIARFAKDRRSR
jgi:TPR repeat protein